MNIRIIYTIKNKINNKNYVGQTINGMNNRWIKHKSSLRLGNHNNIFLQEDWNKYGETCFEIIELESLLSNKNESNDREKHWCNELQSYYFQNGYNIREAGVDGKIDSLTKDKISKKTSGKNNGFYGRTHNKETRINISKNNVGKHSGNLHPNFGKNLPKSTREKISKKLIGKEPGNKMKFTEDQKQDILSKINSGLSLNKISKIYSCRPYVIRRELNLE